MRNNMLTQEPAVLSDHRHISFTAHYTGYRWYLLGISHPAFATRKGKWLTVLLQPLENWAERHVGTSMRTVLQTRHQLINQQVDQLLQRHPDLQIVEFAAGLSPRGWRYRKQYPALRYVEVDLPDMVTVKKQALHAAGQAHAEVMAIDLFSPQLGQLFQQLDQTKPLLIVSEGLINYFSLTILQQFWSDLARYGADFADFYYISDLYPEPIQHKWAQTVVRSGQLLKFLSKSAFSFYFKSPQEVKDFFASCGFTHTQVLQPKALSQQITTTNEHLGDFVWIIKAQLSHAPADENV